MGLLQLLLGLLQLDVQTNRVEVGVRQRRLHLTHGLRDGVAEAGLAPRSPARGAGGASATNASTTSIRNGMLSKGCHGRRLYRPTGTPGAGSASATSIHQGSLRARPVH